MVVKYKAVIAVGAFISSVVILEMSYGVKNAYSVVSNRHIPKFLHREEDAKIDDPWRDVPSLELVIRTTSMPKYIKLYSTWFLKSLKLFWPSHLLNITLVMDDENKEDHATAARLSKMWPYPKIAYRKPGDASVYMSNQRRRMYLSYFYPEEYVKADYVGYVDTDTMFTTVVTPKSLFVDGKPTVQARIGQPYTQMLLGCWSDVSEYFLGEKEALQCMSYFPITYKVEHIVKFRKFVEKRHGKAFNEIFKLSFNIRHPLNAWGGCVCQFSVLCNYIWYHHRDEYDFHLQLAPNGNWKGELLRPSQQTYEYFKNIDPIFRVPKPRVSIHAAHFMDNGTYVTDLDLMKEPCFSLLKRKIREGLCRSIGFDRCPEKCADFKKNSVQSSIYSFEMFSWTWDDRCFEEQQKHYANVKELILYNEKHHRQMFSLDKYSDVCNEKFDFNF